jgi:hypothetical protein
MKFYYPFSSFLYATSEVPDTKGLVSKEGHGIDKE